MNFAVEKLTDSIPLYIVEGELSLYNSGDLKSSLMEQVNNSSIAIDLSSCRSIDSSSLGVFMKCQKDFIQQNREIVLINNNKYIASIFEVTRFAAFFKIFASRDEAVRYFQKARA
jgi:anti-anti-sigma factor